MNILFITLLDIRSISEHNLYSDLMREFAKNGHDVSIVSPIERRCGEKTHMIVEYGEFKNKVHILKLKTGNIQKTNILEKGISTILLESQLKAGIKKYFNTKQFDMVLYSTPPITIVNVVKYVKQRDNATTYLMLKDIFPQNAVDLGMMSKKGIRGFAYRYFRNKEKKLYRISDRIGCMSPANIEYVKKHNPEIDEEKLELCPNCIDAQDIEITDEERIQLRKKYKIPLDKKVFVYGGNLGKPQGIDFLIQCLKSQLNNQKVFFLIVGNGTEYYKLKRFFGEEKPNNMKLMDSIPKDEYDKMIAACDIGMIFLDYRFTIPNFPSRLLSYMQAGLPVLACTDKNTDVGEIITEGQFGWWCESNQVHEFSQIIEDVAKMDLKMMGKNAKFILAESTSNRVYRNIIGNNK